MKHKILLMEDDTVLNDTVTDFLEQKGYEVVSVYDSHEADEAIYETTFDLFLLDVNVPGINGFDLLKRQRNENIKTPAIYITSLNSLDSLEEGYQSGGDDYIRKPFALKELLLRVESILKRGYFHNNENKIKIDENIYFDVDSVLLYIDSQIAPLNSKELKLLKLFLQNKDQIVCHENIYNALWDYDETPSESSLRTYIKNIRKLIGKEKIVSIKKLGYKFT